MKDVYVNSLDRAMSLDAARFATPVYELAKLAFGDQCETVDVFEVQLLDNKDGTYSYTARFRPHPTENAKKPKHRFKVGERVMYFGNPAKVTGIDPKDDVFTYYIQRGESAHRDWARESELSPKDKG